MNRPDTRELNAFVDAELPLDRQLEIEQALAADADLRAEVQALRALRESLHRHADRHPAPAGLLPRQPDAAPPGWRRWLDWRPYIPALVLAALAVVGIDLARWSASRDDQVMQEVIAGHVRSTVGHRLLDVVSSDQHTVKPWLSSRLDYSPPVADAPVPGASFLGGRIDYVDGRPVAALVYQQRQHVIDAYVWPVDAPDAALRSASQRGFNTVHWVRHGMRYWLVSDINRDELGAFAQALDRAVR